MQRYSWYPSVRQPSKMVLDDGKLVGKGTHEELLKNCNVYKEICMSQFSSQEVAQL